MENARYEEFIRYFLEVNKRYKECIQREGYGLDIHKTPFRVLCFLEKLGEDYPTQADIAEELNVSAPAAACMLKKMEASGYVQRRVDQRDGRANRVMITEKGQAILLESRERFDKVDTMMLDRLTDKQIAELNRCFAIMANNLARFEVQQESRR